MWSVDWQEGQMLSLFSAPVKHKLLVSRAGFNETETVDGLAVFQMGRAVSV
jgi:hypothetical protein